MSWLETARSTYDLGLPTNTTARSTYDIYDLGLPTNTTVHSTYDLGLPTNTVTTCNNDNHCSVGA